MDETQFWSIIEDTKSVIPYELDAHEEKLLGHLDSLLKEDLADFIRFLMTKASLAESWTLWAAAWLVRDEIGNFGCGDDAFWGFTVGLVCQGKRLYEAVIADPDSLSDFDNAHLLKESDALGYSAVALYEEKFGELPFNPYAILESGTPGDEWNDDDMAYFAQKFPKCVKRWGLPLLGESLESLN